MTTAYNSKPVLRFASHGNFLFPLRRDDFDAIRNQQVTIFKIRTSAAEILKKNLLKEYRFSVVPFASTVFPSILRDTLKSISEDRMRLTAEGNKVTIKYTDDAAEEVNKQIIKFNNLLGRFCFKSTRESKTKDGINYARFIVKFDPTINPSSFYGDPCSEEAETETLITLSSYARVSLKKVRSKVYEGRMAFMMVFEDLVGTEWRESFTRCFEAHSLKEDELIGAANFFLGLTNIQKSN